MIPNPDLTAMAVAGKEEVNRVGLQFVVVLRVMTQEDLVSGEFAEAGQKLCVYLPGDLLGGNTSEIYIFDFSPPLRVT